VSAGTASAFDTGTHFDLTEDVLKYEGFSPNAIATVQSANFMVDFYEFIGKPKIRKALDDDCRPRLKDVLRIADAQHFDDLHSTVEVARKWDTMLAATRETIKQKSPPNTTDLLGLMALLGMSLHNVQDFYTHSNWVEGNPNGPPLGRGSLTRYGPNPTWLSLDRADREQLDVYTDLDRPSIKRGHGVWDSDSTALNKDWSGRPYYSEAYIAAWFATRQWVRLFQSFVDPVTWGKMQQFSKASFDPSRDWDYARKISFYGGHWYGNGGPEGAWDMISSRVAATSPDFLVPAVLGYMGGRCISKNPSALRAEAERLLLTWGDAAYQGPENPTLPNASPENVRFVQLKVHKIAAIGGGDGFLGGDMDWYARAMIGGQRYWSGLIDEHDAFDFDHAPYAPWTMTKAEPVVPDEVPMYVQLMELERKEDTQVDVNPRQGLKTIVLRYSPSTGLIRGDLTGKAGVNMIVEGKGDCQCARIHLSVSHLTGTCLR